MSKPNYLPFVMLCLLSFAPVSPAQAQPPKPAPSLTAAEKLRHLLPLPAATFNPKVELNIGLNYSPNHESELRRESNDYSAQIVQVKRKLTGGLTDAPRYIILGLLYRAAGLNNKSNAAFRHSEAVCRLALRSRPDNGFALAEYGRTLNASGQHAEAEIYLENAAQIVPKSADVWLALGSVLAGQISPSNEAKTHFARDAAAAYNQTILLAPRDPAVWAARGNFRDWVLPSLHGKMVSHDGLDDYERAAALAPRDPYAQAMIPTIDYSAVEIEYGIPTSPEAAGKETPEADRRAKAALRRITEIAKSTCGRQSASAYTARGWVQFQFCYDPHGAQKSLRLALQQNANQQDAIDYQMHVAAVTGDYVLLAAACRRELRRLPAVRLHVLLAYAYYYLAQQKPVYWQEARTQMEIAHSLEPRDYACNLGLAVLLLKSKQASDQSRASLLLDKIALQVPRRPKEQQADYDITHGISSALTGNFDDARQYLRLALKNDPTSRPAKSALIMLLSLNDKGTR